MKSVDFNDVYVSASQSLSEMLQVLKMLLEILQLQSYNYLKLLPNLYSQQDFPSILN